MKLRSGVTAALPAILLAATMIMAGPGAVAAAAAPTLCASSSHAALAARISRGIEAARHGRVSFVAVEVDDPGAGAAWGLTRITAADETRLLWLLLQPNRMLDTSSRDYALALMADVTPPQRWGVPAGAPKSLVVHVKNGWLPLAPYEWRINSLAGFTGHGKSYSIVVLTQDNPTMSYGVATVEKIAEAVNRDLNPGATARVPAVVLSPAQQAPDETLP